MQHFITVLKPNAFSFQCHFYRYFLCVGVWMLVAQSCPALCDHMDCNPPGSSVHGILQARILEWVALPSSRGSSRPQDRTHVSYVSCIGRWVLCHWCHLMSVLRIQYSDIHEAQCILLAIKVSLLWNTHLADRH